MVLENKVYVPTLAVRASEMNGLEFLPGATKDLMVPCFLLAPWASSNHLERTIGRIERAFPKKGYFLDLDRDYSFTDLDSNPQRELAQLMDPAGCFQNWVSFVETHGNVWPCIQSRGQAEAELRSQIEAFQALGRPYCMRIVRDRFPENFEQIVRAFASAGSADFAIILEGGWVTDPLSLSAWFSGIISDGLRLIDATVPIVLSCTSMPKMFTSFSSESPIGISFSNRTLLEQVSRGSNRARVVYGDWGSTRPRESAGFASRPIDRIDYPTSNTWFISRNKERGWGFKEAAIAIKDSDFWDGNIGIWGEEMIRSTAINEALGIDTPQKNVAARVNLHLHRQAFYDRSNINPSEFDEEWED